MKSKINIWDQDIIFAIYMYVATYVYIMYHINCLKELTVHKIKEWTVDKKD